MPLAHLETLQESIPQDRLKWQVKYTVYQIRGAKTVLNWCLSFSFPQTWRLQSIFFNNKTKKNLGTDFKLPGYTYRWNVQVLGHWVLLPQSLTFGSLKEKVSHKSRKLKCHMYIHVGSNSPKMLKENHFVPWVKL